MTPTVLKEEIRSLGNPTIAEHSQRFFKTGRGQYGESDKFLGIRVPIIRRLVRKHKDVPLDVVLGVMQSEFHEERLFAVLALVAKFKKGSEDERRQIYEQYLENLRYVNNWDLVDGSADRIIGAYLRERDKALLYEFAISENIWRRRIAIFSTLHYIKNGEFDDTLRIAKILLHDKHDLIHKAVGWMLREIGNRDAQVEKAFLREHYREMPRTMLRYAIEKFPEEERQAYLKGTI